MPLCYLATETINERNIDINPSHPAPGRGEKINLNFYFHTSLRYLRRFYGSLWCLERLNLSRHHKEVRKKNHVNFISGGGKS